MLDRRIRPLIDPPLARVGGALARAGVTADALTVTGAAAAVAAGVALAFQAYGLGLLLILLNRLLDGLDGAVARATRPTDYGGYLDIVGDFLFYAAVPLGFGLSATGFAAPAMVLLASFILSGTSFLAWAAITEKRGGAVERGGKGFYYMAGLAEGTETILIFVAMCLWPTAFPWFAYSFAALCVLTAVGRALKARAAFR